MYFGYIEVTQPDRVACNGMCECVDKSTHNMIVEVH